MVENIVVIALDAADYALAREWDCENILLETHGEIETFTYGTETPSTLEVWPSVATGLHPEDHRIINENEAAQSWGNPVLRMGSKVTQYLPTTVRSTLGKPFHRAGQKKQFQQTDAPTYLKMDMYFLGQESRQHRTFQKPGILCFVPMKRLQGRNSRVNCSSFWGARSVGRHGWRKLMFLLSVFIAIFLISLGMPI